VLVLSPLVLPLHSRALVRALNARLLRAQVGRAARRAGLRRPVLWGYVPQAESLVPVLDPELVVYHCVDDIAAQERVDSASFAAAEARLLAQADLVLASAPGLAQRLRGQTRAPVALMPNVADTELFAAALDPGPIDPALAALPAPRIVFCGAVAAAKLDLELIAGLARARPDWSVALVGPVGLGDPHTDVSGLRALANVHLLGPRAYRELPDVLRGADAGLIPYTLNRLTASVFPMKVYEYLAAGLPVVSTPLPSLAEVQGITLAATAEETVGALERLLAGAGPEAAAAHSRLAAGHSWDARLAEIAVAVSGAEAAVEAAAHAEAQAETAANAEAAARAEAATEAAARAEAATEAGAPPAGRAEP
jgi:glycosyltransferase involved in cell wall biosynthesis